MRKLYRLKAKLFFFVCLFGLLSFLLCGFPGESYKTRNVIICVMDGVRWSETFGDTDLQYIPRMGNELRPQGTLFTHFYNDDVTITRAGHSTILTGTWQKNRNKGPTLTRPTVFDYAGDELNIPPEKAWIIFGKGDYAFTPQTTFPAYVDRFSPYFENDFGEDSLEGDRAVFNRISEVIDEHQARLIFANFGATDHFAHSGYWERHTQAIRRLDDLLVRLWEKIQTSSNYKDQTTLILLNDHGLHTDGVLEGFAEHGDSCEGCRHVMLLIVGPDIKKAGTVSRPTFQIDIAPTVGELLGFQTPLARGEVLKDCLLTHLGLNRKEARTECAQRAVRMEELAGGSLIKQKADSVLNTHSSEAGTLPPSADSAILLWGMLSAHDKTGDPRYLEFVKNWAEKNLEPPPDRAGYAGLVLSELAYRVKDAHAQKGLIDAAKRMALQIEPLIGRLSSEEQGRELALYTIFLASLGEAAKDQALWKRAKDALISYLRAADVKKGWAAAEMPVSGREKGQKSEVSIPTGKILPITPGLERTPHSSWILLAVAFVRSHGFPFKGEYLSDVPDLRAEGFIQAYLAARDLPAPGSIWPNFLQSALNIAALKELENRISLFGSLDEFSELELSGARPGAPEILPPLPLIKREIPMKITGKNYNVQYGFPAYRDINFTGDLLRLYTEYARTDLEVGSLLLALAPLPAIPLEPQFKTPE